MQRGGERASSVWRATAGGFGAILLWSTTVALARSLSEDVGPITGAAAAYSVSGVGALVSLLRSKERRRRILDLPAKYLIGCGVLFVGYMSLLFLAIGLADSHRQVLEVGLLNYLWPALTLVFSLALLKTKASWLLIPGTLLALSGVFLVLTQRAKVTGHSLLDNFGNNPLAYSLALAAAVSWALYSNLTRKWAGGRDEGAVGLFLPVTAAFLLLIACFVDEPRAWTRQSLAEAVFLGVATYAAYALWDRAMRLGNMTLTAAASYLAPFFSTLMSALYFAVVPARTLWIGCGMLVLGSLLSWRAISEPAPAGSAQSTETGE